MSVVEKREITVAEARKLLEAGPEELDPLQRRVLDYTTKFSKLPPEESEKLVEELAGEGDMDRATAVQIANCMPTSSAEVRTFLGRQRIIAEETMNRILGIIKKYRSE